MPGILDIAPPEIVTERFEIRGGLLEVRALRNREWAALLRRFPEMQQTMAAAGEPSGDLLDELDVIVPAVIAAGAGACGDERTEALIVERLTEAERAEIFGAIMRLTMPPAPLAGGPAPAGQDAGQAETTSPTPSSS